ncbi:hypothetical protein HELRODRAFT_192763 [Helobdella robusta]|uniref:Uncharacterized protein n=1 Tax=Helobdella robusta TaxID=6412 RepID=T1FU96_HELRO|nr:hypothetical protein HELRODRAFT_192763 [Helobdella robusta]ESN99712.1 hypothetical protein HELRODRAFT_192763 [Helobdella robusta]
MSLDRYFPFSIFSSASATTAASNFTATTAAAITSTVATSTASVADATTSSATTASTASTIATATTAALVAAASIFLCGNDVKTVSNGFEYYLAASKFVKDDDFDDSNFGKKTYTPSIPVKDFETVEVSQTKESDEAIEMMSEEGEVVATEAEKFWRKIVAEKGTTCSRHLHSQMFHLDDSFEVACCDIVAPRELNMSTDSVMSEDFGYGFATGTLIALTITVFVLWSQRLKD